jgi:hypothetical protein
LWNPIVVKAIYLLQPEKIINLLGTDCGKWSDFIRNIVETGVAYYTEYK